ncbi:MAG: hypothetical protein R3321_11420 [Nitrososphaeraceae archaeon]|nr:hypothetical protein [Nitrososphaeraceae archaeon]
MDSEHEFLEEFRKMSEQILTQRQYDTPEAIDITIRIIQELREMFRQFSLDDEVQVILDKLTFIHIQNLKLKKEQLKDMEKLK